MKYTQYALRIFEVLESGEWRSSNEIADLVATPLANLKTAFDRLVGDGVIERNTSRSPAQYRRTPEPRGTAKRAAETLQQEIARERVPAGLRMRRDDPQWQAMSEKAIGYCGLVLPQENHFHGFFVMPGHEDQAKRFITQYKMHMPDATDLAIANGLAAAFAALAAGDFGRDRSIEGKLGPIVTGIALMIEAPYFIVVAERQGTGYSTNISVVPASEIAMAQVVLQQTPAEYIAGVLDKMPEVAGIKARRAVIQRMN